jgi:hypothetical protein
MIPDPDLCPPDIQYDIAQYVNKGVPPGNFLAQVLSNNLKESFMGADETNLEALPHIVCYCYNRLPSVAWGSRQRVSEIIEAGGFSNYCQLCRKEDIERQREET